MKDSALDPSVLLAFSLRCTPEQRHRHHNMLLEGPEASTDSVLRLLVPRLCAPLVWSRRCEPFALPTGEIGTLILEDASSLDRDAQTQLLRWLDDVSPRPRIVCTTARPLFGLVVTGLFDVDLYYRLNVMLLHVNIRHQAGLRRHATASEAESDRQRTEVTVRSSSLPAFERPFPLEQPLAAKKPNEPQIESRLNRSRRRVQRSVGRRP